MLPPDDSQRGKRQRKEGEDKEVVAQQSMLDDGGQKDVEQTTLLTHLMPQLLDNLPDEVRQVVLRAASFSGAPATCSDVQGV